MELWDICDSKGIPTGRVMEKGKDLGEALLIPNVMLRHEQDMFLDDVTLEEAQAALGTPIQVVENDGFSVLSAMTGQEI